MPMRLVTTVNFGRVRSVLGRRKIKSVLYVCGKRVDSDEERAWLQLGIGSDTTLAAIAGDLCFVTPIGVIITKSPIFG